MGDTNCDTCDGPHTTPCVRLKDEVRRIRCSNIDTESLACAILEHEAEITNLEGRRSSDLRRANERANEWEGLAAGRLAALQEARTEIVALRKTAGEHLAYVLQRERDDLKQFCISDGDDAGLFAKALADNREAKARILLLEKSLRFIEHVDKTPFYGCTGLQADKDRRGQLPEKAGQRWKTPREMVRELKLPVVRGVE